MDKAVGALEGSLSGGGKGGIGNLKTDELIVRDSKFLDAGIFIDNPYGKYTSPIGVPYEQKALLYVENLNDYHKYEALKPVDNVTILQIAEAFEQPGGGMQYELPSKVCKLVKDKFLREIK